MEAKESKISAYQRKSRLIGELFARALDHTIRAAVTSGRESEDAIEEANRYLRRVVNESGDPPPVQTSHPASSVNIPEVVLKDKAWATGVVAPIRRATPLPTRTRMEARDALFHLVVASEHRENNDQVNATAHIAMAREHLVLAAEEALEHVVRHNLRKVKDAFSWPSSVARKTIGRQLPSRHWSEDYQQTLRDLGEARRHKGRPERREVFLEHAKRALDTSVSMADASDQGRVALWRLIADLLVAAIGVSGAIIGILKAFS